MAMKITCGFGRVGVRETKVLGLSEEKRTTKCVYGPGQGHMQRYETFKNIFGGGGKENQLSFENFCESVTHIGKVLNSWSRSRREEKVKFLEHFSLDNWEKLDAATKQEHSIVGPCRACLLDHGDLWNFYNKQIKSTWVRNALTDSVPRKTQAKRTFAELQQEEASKQKKRAKNRKLVDDIVRSIQDAQRTKNKDAEVAFADGIPEDIYRLAEEV
ncbi:Hypp4307 [Branchiostoma lanceolatum]|uniref:Hypp4307 protein n=1 Tax=Branchiostoma lanceolatum TaxID=7740 RepID=A0A8K0A8Z2_BRALA|nr:Hypp4307 [Branchiostoma lanceolatum]